MGFLSEGYRSLADPILTKVPPGGYAKFVTVMCPLIQPSSRAELSPHGAMANLAVGTCIGLNGTQTVEELVQRFAPAYESGSANARWNAAYFPALAEHFCPQNFKK